MIDPALYKTLIEMPHRRYLAVINSVRSLINRRALRDEHPPLDTPELHLVLYHLGTDGFARLRDEIQEHRRDFANEKRLEAVRKRRKKRAAYMRKYRRNQKKSGTVNAPTE